MTCQPRHPPTIEPSLYLPTLHDALREAIATRWQDRNGVRKAREAIEVVRTLQLIITGERATPWRLEDARPIDGRKHTTHAGYAFTISTLEPLAAPGEYPGKKIPVGQVTRQHIRSMVETWKQDRVPEPVVRLRLALLQSLGVRTVRGAFELWHSDIPARRTAPAHQPTLHQVAHHVIAALRADIEARWLGLADLAEFCFATGLDAHGAFRLRWHEAVRSLSSVRWTITLPSLGIKVPLDDRASAVLERRQGHHALHVFRKLPRRVDRCWKRVVDKLHPDIRASIHLGILSGLAQLA